MSGTEALTHDEDIDIGGIMIALKRRWWVILGVAIVTAVGLFLVLSALDKKYLSTARVLVKESENSFTQTTQDASAIGQRPSLDEQAVGSEVEVVQSANLALNVIRNLNLVDIPEFRDEIRKVGFLDKLLGIEQKPVSEVESAMLDVFKKRLDVYAIENSRVIVVEFWSHNPQLARQIVANLTDEYLKFKIAERSTTEEQATIWLDPRIKELEVDLEQAEASVADYRASEGLLRVDDENALLTTQQLSEASTELSRLKAQRASTQARVASLKQALREGASIDAIPEVLNSPIVQALLERETELQGEVSDLSVTLLSGHPRLQSANSQLSKVRGRLRDAAQDVITSLERDVAASKRAESDLEIEIDRLKENASRMEEKLVELRARQRDAETARELLTEYRSRSLEAKSRSGLNEADVEIISPASFPNKAFFPKIVPFTAAGTVGTTLLALLFVIAGSLLTSSAAPATARQEPVTSKQPEGKQASVSDGWQETMVDGAMYQDVMDDAGLGGASTAGEISGAQQQTASQSNPAPHTEPMATNAPSMETNMPHEAAMISNTTSLDAISKDYRVVGVRYAADALVEYGDSRVAVLSPGGQKGSVTACILARTLARRKRRVLVIDFATGATTTAEMLGTGKYPGFFNLVSGTAAPKQGVFKDRKSQVRIVPGGGLLPEQPVPQPEAISDMVDVLAQGFDHVILDIGSATIDELNIVADQETIAIVSTIKAGQAEVVDLMDSLEYDGFEYIVAVAPQKEDLVVPNRAAQAAA